jgi:UDP-N-acetylmuramate dehydrogenase
MKTADREKLLRLLPCPARELVPLAPLTTFRIGGPAQILAEPSSSEALLRLIKIIRQENIAFFYMGLGSNLLVSDEGFDGVVIKAQGDLNTISVKDSLISAGPGARLLDVTAKAAANNLSGMETLSGIPGSLGGGSYMNAGAYGGEIADHLLDIEVIDEHNHIVTITKKQIGFGYRSAPALQSKIILSSRFKLAMGERLAIYREMRRVWKLRRAKQPLELPSAGSIFKRPTGDYAGRLIEAVEGKGAQIGGAQVSSKHAGIFVNVGGATASDVAALVREIRRRVYESFGILLETEIKPVGFDHDPFAITQ